MCSLAIWPAMQPSIMSYNIDISTRPRHFITAPCHKPKTILSFKRWIYFAIRLLVLVVRVAVSVVHWREDIMDLIHVCVQRKPNNEADVPSFRCNLPNIFLLFHIHKITQSAICTQIEQVIISRALSNIYPFLFLATYQNPIVHIYNAHKSMSI